MTNATDPNSNQWKIIALAAGVAGGALFGLLTAVLYTRTAESTLVKRGKLPSVGTMPMIGLSISLIGLLRQIVSLASED